MVTYIFYEVWSNLCIQFSSVKKGHSHSSLFTNMGSHVQYLTLAILVPVEMFCHLHSCIYSYSSYIQPNMLQLCVRAPWMLFRLLSCSRGRKQIEALCKHEASLWSCFTWTSAFHQGRHAPTGGHTPTLSAGLGLILCLPISLLDSLTVGFPALYIPCSLAHLCLMFPAWLYWEKELAFTLSSKWMVREK